MLHVHSSRITHLLAGLLLSVIGSAAPRSLSAQAPADTAARRVAMQRLAFMLGDWSGDADVRNPDGSRLRLRQTEHVRSVVGGQVFTVQGVGRVLTDGVPGDTVFHAAATIEWHADSGYVMRSITLDGRHGVFHIEPATEGRGFDWGMAVPGGNVRYRMRLTAEGEWVESGEFMRAGAPPFRFIEMRVRRTEGLR